MLLDLADYPALRDLGAVMLAYGLGTLCGGYYLVRALTGLDVRQLGSGAAGGTNAARVLGRWAFVAAASFDCIKGVVAVLIAKAAGLDGMVLGAVVFAVVLGHVCPVQLGFRGGRGVATSFGSYAIYFPLALLGIVLVSVIAYSLTRKRKVAGMIGYAVSPATTLFLADPGAVFAAIAATSALVIAAHHRRLRPVPIDALTNACGEETVRL